MPIASPEVYAEMLDRAKAGKFAYPAINCTSSQTIVAAIRGFAEAESDGIVQFSWGGAEFASGQAVKSMVAGAVALAEFAHSIAAHYDVNIALHTDHCPKDKLPGFMEPLLKVSQERVAKGLEPLFQSHMWDGSAVPLKENMEISQRLLEECRKANIILEIEIGVVGGEEDGVEASHDAKLFSTVEDGLATAEALGLGENGRYMVAATFGNVHGVYKPGNVVLTPKVLAEIQMAVGAKYGKDKPFDLVFHGGSGLAAQRDPRGPRLRRREDEHRHRHPVRVHASGGRPHVHELLGRPEGRRRGRQQEAVRPARLGQAGRGRHGRPRRRRLPGPALRRHPHVLTVSPVLRDELTESGPDGPGFAPFVRDPCGTLGA